MRKKNFLSPKEMFVFIHFLTSYSKNHLTPLAISTLKTCTLLSPNQFTERTTFFHVISFINSTIQTMWNVTLQYHQVQRYKWVNCFTHTTLLRYAYLVWKHFVWGKIMLLFVRHTWKKKPFCSYPHTHTIYKLWCKIYWYDHNIFQKSKCWFLTTLTLHWLCKWDLMNTVNSTINLKQENQLQKQHIINKHWIKLF